MLASVMMTCNLAVVVAGQVLALVASVYACVSVCYHDVTSFVINHAASRVAVTATTVSMTLR